MRRNPRKVFFAATDKGDKRKRQKKNKEGVEDSLL
jgi:hypothetical protein